MFLGVIIPTRSVEVPSATANSTVSQVEPKVLRERTSFRLARPTFRRNLLSIGQLNQGRRISNHQNQNIIHSLNQPPRTKNQKAIAIFQVYFETWRTSPSHVPANASSSASFVADSAAWMASTEARTCGGTVSLFNGRKWNPGTTASWYDSLMS